MPEDDSGVFNLDQFRRQKASGERPGGSYSVNAEGGIAFPKEKPEKPIKEVLVFAQSLVERYSVNTQAFQAGSADAEALNFQRTVAAHDATTTQMLQMILEREMNQPGYYTSVPFLYAAAEEFVKRLSPKPTATS